MEEKIINRLRKCKLKLRTLYKITKRYVDIGSESMIDSETLYTLQMISKIDEELTDIIYLILDNKNS